RGDLPTPSLAAQAAFALRVRDDISRVTDLVNQIRSVREQLKARAVALDARKSDPRFADLIKDSEAAIKKIDDLENRLHNPSAEVVYDILAMRGGTKLYSRLAFLQQSATDGDGVPTAGMTQVLTEEETYLGTLDAETKHLLDNDVATLNSRASELRVPFVVV